MAAEKDTLIKMTKQLCLQDVEAVTDISGARKLAKYFDPPVSTKKCETVEKYQTRLKLALRKCAGEMKDVDALGNMMREKKKMDEEQRGQLLALYGSYKKLLSTMDEKMRKHVEKKGEAEPEQEMEKYLAQLKVTAHKLIVAGETSSGKSTLMNIFLNEGNGEKEPLLPVKLLSCTATICEIEYSAKAQAAIVTRGVENSIPFEDKEKYIYKESDRDRLYDHDLVRLKMPCFFLKSGIKLIDTPGVGESTQMGGIIKDYVMQNDPFGFIFTIESARAGGVLSKFTNLLSDLSGPDFEDNFGQQKFDPRSCIFVANFWDRVADKDKEDTRDNIFKTLSNQPCMKSFNPETQVFFLDADFAYHTRNAGFITDDFATFVDGLERFVLQEQRRKLKLAFGWLENSLTRTLHPLKSYIRRMKQTHKERTKKKEEFLKALDETETRAQVTETRSNIEIRKESCSKQLRHYMVQKETHSKVARWTSRDLPKQQLGDDWVLMEIKLDEAIDQRVSDVLKQWEDESKIISTAEKDLMEEYVEAKDQFANDIEQIELSLRSDYKDKEFTSTPISQIPEEKKKFGFPTPDDEETDDIDKNKREFKVMYGKTNGYDIMAGNPDVEKVKDSLSLGPMVRVLSKKRKKPKPPKASDDDKAASLFHANKVGYMEERAAKIYSAMCNEEYAKSVIDEQLMKVEEYVSVTVIEILKRIKTNKKLLEAIAGEKRNLRDVQERYMPVSKSVTNILDDVVRFEQDNLIEPSYNTQDIVLESDVRSSLFATLYHGSLAPEFVARYAKKGMKTRRFDVTVKKVNLRPSQYKHQEKYLRKLSSRPDLIVRSMGTYRLQNELVLVLNHKLITAREFFFSAGKFVEKRGRHFLLELSTAISFLHIKRLVHMEVSLDSILVKTDQKNGMNTLLLSNLGEPSDVEFSPDNLQKPVVGHIHLPPEVLHSKSQYTQAGDMFGIGVIMMEMWHQTDVFKKMRENMTLQAWIKEKDQGSKLWEEFKRIKSPKVDPTDKLYSSRESLVKKCLDFNPNQRVEIATWNGELVKTSPI